MGRLVHACEREILINFELGRKCRTSLRLKSLSQTLLVAFKVQTTAANQFYVKPPSGIIIPGEEYILDIVLKPQSEFPASIPFSNDRFVIKTTVAPISNVVKELPIRAPDNWFNSDKSQVFLDANLRVVYVGSLLLRYVVAGGDVITLKQILTRQGVVSGTDDHGKTALHIAAIRGNLEILKILLDAGVEINDVNCSSRTPLLEAIARGHTPVVRELLRRKAYTELKDPQGGGYIAAIHMAATLENVEILEDLIRSGVDLEIVDADGRTALHFAAQNAMVENLRALLNAGAQKDVQTGDGKTAIYMAAEKGLKDVLQVLLEFGANVHSRARNGLSPVEIAADNDEMEIVELIETGDQSLQAARQGDVDTLVTLLHAKGHLWMSDAAGWTTLHIAAFKGHTQVVRLLLLLDGSADALCRRDNDGHTPLHCAAEGGSIVIVELLLAMGADPQSTTSRGAKPADLAIALGHTAVAKVLRHHECHIVASPSRESPYSSRSSIKPFPMTSPSFQQLSTALRISLTEPFSFIQEESKIPKPFLPSSKGITIREILAVPIPDDNDKDLPDYPAKQNDSFSNITSCKESDYLCQGSPLGGINSLFNRQSQSTNVSMLDRRHTEAKSSGNSNVSDLKVRSDSKMNVLIASSLHKPLMDQCTQTETPNVYLRNRDQRRQKEDLSSHALPTTLMTHELPCRQTPKAQEPEKHRHRHCASSLA